MHNIFLLLEALAGETESGFWLAQYLIHKHDCALELTTELLKNRYDSPTASMKIPYV